MRSSKQKQRKTYIRLTEYVFRHFQNFAPHLTPVKLANIALNLVERELKVCRPRSMPLYMKVEPTPLCQLRCPGCVESKQQYREQFRKGMEMSLEDFKRVVDPISRTLLGISMSRVGEPLLNRNIASLIEYAHKKNIAVSFPTNLSVKLSKQEIETLVKSGVDSLLVSLDGASEETYKQYRVGGNFSLVVNNVKSIADAKRKFGLKTPRLTWKFVVFDHNKHEQDTVGKTYRELGFDSFDFVTDWSTDAKKKTNAAYNANVLKKKRGCFWLWHAMVIGWDGEVFPCCRWEHFDIGNAIQTNSMELWRGEQYRGMRQGFASEAGRSEMHPACKRCMSGKPVAAVYEQGVTAESSPTAGSAAR